MNDRFLSFLGIMKKAGKLYSGHDAVKEEARNGKAELVIFTADASERLKNEFRNILEGKNTATVYTGYTINDIYCATGGKAAVLCVTDSKIAIRLKELLSEIKEV